MLILVPIVYIEFNDRFKHLFDNCKEAIWASNNRQESRDVVALLLYEPIYRHTLLHRTAGFVRVSIPLSSHDAFNPKRSEAEIQA